MHYVPLLDNLSYTHSIIVYIIKKKSKQTNQKKKTTNFRIDNYTFMKHESKITTYNKANKWMRVAYFSNGGDGTLWYFFSTRT